MPHVERLGAPGPTEDEFEQLLAPHDPAIAETARALRRMLAAAFPEAVEQVDFGNKLLAVGKTMQMRDLAFAIIPHSAHVNLQLADGVDLPNGPGKGREGRFHGILRYHRRDSAISLEGTFPREGRNIGGAAQQDGKEVARSVGR